MRSIAVVGMSCRFPGAGDSEAFWRLLERGGDAIAEVPPERWDVEACYDALRNDDADPLTHSLLADLFLEGDNAAFGRKSAEYMVDKLGKKGNILILEGIPSTVNTDRVNAALDVFRQHPDIHILGQQSGMWNRQKALEVTQAMLTKNPQIDAIWAQDDDMALGAEQARVPRY